MVVEHDMCPLFPLVSAELMLLGFISLLLTAMESYVASICVKTTILEHWSPCRAIDEDKVSPPPEAAGGARRRLLAPDTWPTMAWGEGALHHRRILSQNTAATCKPVSPMLTCNGLNLVNLPIYHLRQ